MYGRTDFTAMIANVIILNNNIFCLIGNEVIIMAFESVSFLMHWHEPLTRYQYDFHARYCFMGSLLALPITLA